MSSLGSIISSNCASPITYFFLVDLRAISSVSNMGDYLSQYVKLNYASEARSKYPTSSTALLR